MLHHEAHSRTRLAATEAFVYTLGRRHDKRRRLLIMERTACLIDRARSLESHEVADHIFDLSKVENSVYRLLRYHLLVYFFVINILYRTVVKLLPLAFLRFFRLAVILLHGIPLPREHFIHPQHSYDF